MWRSEVKLGFGELQSEKHMETKEEKVTGLVREKFGPGSVIGVREKCFKEGYSGNCV